MPNQSTRRKPWYRLRNIVLLLVGVLIAVLTYSVYWAYTVEPNVATDYGRQMEQLSEQAQPEGENAWPHIMDAVAICGGVEASFSRSGRPAAHEDRIDYHVLLPGDATEEERAMAREALNRLEAQGAIDALSRASSCPRIVRPRPGLDEGDLLFMPLTDLADAHHLAVALTARTHVGLAKGDIDTAVQSLDLALYMADACSFQPTIIEQLVGQAIANYACRELRYDLGEQDLDAATLRRLAEVLDRRLPLAPIALGLDGERLGFKDLVQRYYSDNGRGGGALLTGGDTGSALATIEQAGPAGAAPHPRLFNLAGIVFASRRETIAKADAFYDRMISRSQMTRAEREADPFHTNELIQELGWRHMLLRMLLPAIDRVIENRDGGDAELAGTRLMLAVGLFAAEHGRYPADLEELVGEILAELPADPFSPDGFVYRLVEDDPLGRPYLLYSIGCDGADDGGESDPDYPARALQRSAEGIDCLFNAPRPQPEGEDRPGD